MILKSAHFADILYLSFSPPSNSKRAEKILKSFISNFSLVPLQFADVNFLKKHNIPKMLPIMVTIRTAKNIITLQIKTHKTKNSFVFVSEKTTKHINGVS